MKKIVLSLSLMLGFGIAAHAQIPDNGVWPAGVVFTDINGMQHDIDAILDNGQSVIIDAFADWCGPCWSYHDAGILEDVNTTYGPSGTDVVRVFGIESDPGEPESNITDAGTGQGDWSHGGTLNYTLADDDNLAGIINLGYYPTLILVCPDRTVTEVGQVSASAWGSAIGNCGSTATNSNDPRLLSNKTFDQYCDGDDVNFRAVMQNYSNTAITSATLKAFNNGTEILSYSWSGNLDPYEAEEVDLGSVSVTNPNNVTIEITSTNDDLSNDDISVSLTQAPQLSLVQSNPVLGIDVEFDGYASEFGMVVDEGAPYTTNLVTLHNDAAGGSTTPLAFVQVGSLSDGDASLTEYVNISNAGCHYVAFVDSYGDGLTAPGGSITIQGASQNISLSDDYGDGFLKLYNLVLDATSGVEENTQAEDLKIFPNPFTNIANVNFTVEGTQHVTIDVYNTVGQKVIGEDLGSVSGVQNYKIDGSNLEAGMYIVNIAIDGEMITKRITLNK